MNKKIISVILCLAIGVASGLVGCGGVTPSSEVVDSTKSQLHIGVFDAGFGTRFIESAAAKFSERFKDYSFEPGKTGVQIHIDPKRSYSGSNLTSAIKSGNNEIYFSETVDYYAMLSQNSLADITDAVTTPLSEFGESKSIEDKMYDQGVNYFKSGDKYYGIPFYESYTGIVYDAELFDDNYFYLGNGGEYVNFSGETIDGRNVGLTAGPDGNSDTAFDNGFPATYDEFFELATYINDCSMTPFIWTGQFPYYANWVGTTLWTDYEGEDNMYINFNVEGTATDLIQSIDGSGNITYMPETAITEDNYYLLGRQAGRYYAAKFLERVVRSGFYNAAYSFSPSTSQLVAQQQFLYSNRLNNKTPIAMLFEGTWWENEASGTFREMASKYANSSKTDRKLGFMPLPKATSDKVGQKQSVLAIGEAAVVVSATTKASIMGLVKKFIQFVRTDEMLADFTAITSVPLSYDYELSEDQYNNQLTYFGRTVWDTKRNSNVVYPISIAPLYLRNQGQKLNSGVLWDAIISGNAVKYMTSYYRDNPAATAKDYFEGVVRDYESTFRAA
ncbi:MAG: hypothetical protein J5697_03395 [Clostridia bacterium]|nr:hypothetical protein [Clostridia bacterium]